MSGDERPADVAAQEEDEWDELSNAAWRMGYEAGRAEVTALTEAERAALDIEVESDEIEDRWVPYEAVEAIIAARTAARAEGYEAGRAEVTAAVEALADELALDTCHRCRHEDCLAQRGWTGLPPSPLPPRWRRSAPTLAGRCVRGRGRGHRFPRVLHRRRCRGGGR